MLDQLRSLLPALLTPRFATASDATLNHESWTVKGTTQSAWDTTLLWVIGLLCLFGLIMITSSSIEFAQQSRAAKHQPFYFLLRQTFALAVGVVALLIAMRVPMKVWERLAPWIFALSVVLLLLVLVPGIGRKVYGARRWINLPGFSFQPSELMKLAAILFAARYAVRKSTLMQSQQKLKVSFLEGFVPIALALALVGGLTLLQRDLGATLVIVAIAVGILFLANLDLRVLVPFLLLVLFAVVLLIAYTPYRFERWVVFLDPWKEQFDAGYQLTQSLLAFGRGGVFGLGLGASVAKLHYLPEAHTDFILAIIGEELGLVGVIAVLAVFAWITWRAFRIGRTAAGLNHAYAALVAQGVGLWFGVQSLINIAVNLGALPTKGLTLPLLSYGGTGLMCNLIAVGLLLRVDWEMRRVQRGYTA